jgi:hypothetical protein
MNIIRPILLYDVATVSILYRVDDDTCNIVSFFFLPYSVEFSSFVNLIVVQVVKK